MPNFQKAGQGIREAVQRLIDQYHPDLAEAEVTYEILFGYGTRDEETGEMRTYALQSKGYPAMGRLEISSQKDRVKGMADMTILLDGDRWKDLTDAQQDALLDHELQHAEVRRDEDGQILLDDCLRPKLKVRPHDFEIGGFVAIVERHKEQALEIVAMKDAGAMVQGLLPWG